LPTSELKNSPAETVIVVKKLFIAHQRINSLNSRHELLTGRQANYDF